MSKRTAIGLVLVLVLSGLAVGQVKSGAAGVGSWLVSGQLGIDLYLGGSSATDSRNEGLQINLAPRLLYFPSRGLGIGGELNLGYDKQDSYSTTDLAIGPRFAYYLLMPRRRYPAACCLTAMVGPDGWWMPYVGASVLYKRSCWGESKGSGFRARAGVGVSPLIGSRGTAMLELGFQHDNLKWEGATSATTGNKLYLEAGFGAFLHR